MLFYNDSLPLPKILPAGKQLGTCAANGQFHVQLTTSLCWIDGFQMLRASLLREAHPMAGAERLLMAEILSA
jgi:hypothetical protein